MTRSLVPQSVGAALRTPGNALESSTRSFMERQITHELKNVSMLGWSPSRPSRVEFGDPGDPHEQEADRIAASIARASSTAAPSGSTVTSGFDFSGVRVHSDAAAARSAREINARAYTVGEHIVFGERHYEPHTAAGQQLLAHELTHVVQQISGRSPQRLQAAPGPASPVPKSEPRTIRFRIKVDRELKEDEFVYEFVRQFYSCTTEAEVRAKLPLWSMDPKRGTRPGEVKQGFAIANVTLQNQTDFESLDAKDKQVINEKTDRRFWDKTGYKPGQKLGTSAEDRKMGDVWMGERNAVLTEDKQRKDIEALPDDVRKIILTDGVEVSALDPEKYTQLLRIAKKLSSVPPAARSDYLMRVNADTTSLDALEESVDRYLQFRTEREQQRESHEAAAKPLLGADAVYKRYRFYKRFVEHSVDKLSTDASKEEKQLAQSIEDAHREALLNELKRKDFNSIEEFGATVEAYRIAFRTQAVDIALDVLTYCEHMLYQERKKLQQGGGAGIAKGVAGTQAKNLYEAARTDESTAKTLQFGREPKEMGVNKLIREVQQRAASERAEGEAAVIRGSGNDPLVAERGTDREKLAGLDEASTQTYLTQTLEKRTAETRTAREELTTDPDRVFKLPDLIAATGQLQGIGEQTIYGQIIQDYIDDEKAKHLLSEIAMGALALALALLVPVGGWIAAAALVAGAGLSTYQAYGAYKEYEEQERNYNLHFLSEEPSLVWVGVAIAAAALDIGVAASTVVKESAAALATLKGPLLEFSRESGDVAKLVSKIEAAEGLQTKVKAALVREAEASDAARAAWRESAGGAMRLNVVAGLLDPSTVRQVFRALYYSVRKGITSLTRLAADAKFLEIAGDLTRMSGAERAELETAFGEVKQLVKLGDAKSMDDKSLLGFIDRWAINRERPGFQAKLLDELKIWKPLTAEQEKALNALERARDYVGDLYAQQAGFLREREQLITKQANPATYTQEGRDRLQEVNEELRGLDPQWNDPKAEQLGDISKAESVLSAAEKEAQRVQVTLYERLRAAAPSPAAQERALKGVTADQIGVVKTTPTALQADHIVSVREISDMEGFAGITWQEQKRIVDIKENLIAMDGAANASKGDRTWRSWRQASNFYEQVSIDAMIARELDVRKLIQARIQEALDSMKTVKR